MGNNPGGFVDPSGLCKDESRLDRLLASISGYGIGLGETVSDFVDSLIYSARHPWTTSGIYLLIHAQEIADQQRAAIQRFWGDLTSGDAERFGHAMGAIGGHALITVAQIEVAKGIAKAASAPHGGSAPGRVSPGVKAVGDDITKLLGKDARVITNQAADNIFLSNDGLIRVRFDINNPSPHANPHVHVEVNVNGKWEKSGPLYPRDVTPK